MLLFAIIVDPTSFTATKEVSSRWQGTGKTHVFVAIEHTDLIMDI